jgi:hypothetical protein
VAPVVAPVERRWAGDRHRWVRHWRATRRPPAFPDTARVLEPHAGTPGDDPVFLFSSTWRSGSTLVQRLLMSDGRTLVWGEPWNRTDLVPRLRESLAPIGEAWPVPGSTIDEVDASSDGVPLTERWVANLFPSVADLLDAHRALFRRLLADTAAAHGHDRWGAKFVRLGVDDARYLRLLFPRARLLFVHRDPADAWASYTGRDLLAYVRYPDDPVISPARFARLHEERLRTFTAAAGELDLLVVDYDELCDSPDAWTKAIGAHVGADLDPAVFATRIGGTVP